MWNFKTWNFKKTNTPVQICFSCHRIVSLNSQKCSHCGTLFPSLFGLSRKLKESGSELFVEIVVWTCSVLYGATLLTDLGGISNEIPWNILSPSLKSLLDWGAVGSISLREGRWWTILSAAWLHGSFFHILFNLLCIKTIAPTVGKLYRSTAKLVIIYTISAASGGLLSSLFNHASIGASGAIFGLFGALLSYGQTHRDSVVENQSLGYLAVGIIFGITSTQVDNWGHFGGFLGGFLATKISWLKSDHYQRLSHILGAILCLFLSALSILMSIINRVDWSPYL